MGSSVSVIARLGIACVCGVLLAGCAASRVMVGPARQAISPQQVKLYLRPPARFEEIALLEASSAGSFTFSDQAQMDAAVGRLKEEAAKVGANGLLLNTTGAEGGAGVGVGSGARIGGGGLLGVGVSVPIGNKFAAGVAIYVIEE